MENKQPHILIVDDDTQTRNLLEDFLVRHGMRVTTAREGREMKRALRQHNFDLIVLDIMMPGEDGFSLCQHLRDESDMPVIMLSAAGRETDRVGGLEVGADDYIVKPFSPRELLARVKAQLRRSQGDFSASRTRMGTLSELIFGDWRLSRDKHCLIAKDDLIIPLSTSEYRLLLAFLEHPQRTLSRDQLMEITCGKEADPFDRTIDVQVGRLRKKLEDDPKNPELIVTVRGGGYQLTKEVAVSNDLEE